MEHKVVYGILQCSTSDLKENEWIHNSWRVKRQTSNLLTVIYCNALLLGTMTDDDPYNGENCLYIPWIFQMLSSPSLRDHSFDTTKKKKTSSNTNNYSWQAVGLNDGHHTAHKNQPKICTRIHTNLVVSCMGWHTVSMN